MFPQMGPVGRGGVMTREVARLHPDIIAHLFSFTCCGHTGVGERGLSKIEIRLASVFLLRKQK